MQHFLCCKNHLSYINFVLQIVMDFDKIGIKVLFVAMTGMTLCDLRNCKTEILSSISIPSYRGKPRSVSTVRILPEMQ